jgi:hypothetical protein
LGTATALSRQKPIMPQAPWREPSITDRGEHGALSPCAVPAGPGASLGAGNQCDWKKAF